MHEDAHGKPPPKASDGPAATSVEAGPRSGAPAPGALRHGGVFAPTVDQLRTFLSHLQAPHRLDTPQTRQLLALHRRLPPTLSPTTVGQAAAQLLTDKIAALEPDAGAPRAQRLPHQVLDTCFLRGRKNFQAAAELGLSERQISRERERALRLLAAELTARPAVGLPPEPLPSIEGHIRRDALLRRLSDAAAKRRLVGVLGDPGGGKTSLVAALAHALGPDIVWWHRIRPGITDSLEALLFELGHLLAREGSPELRNYLAETLPDPLLETATRLALEALSGRRRLLVLDDFGSGSDPKSLETFLEEAVARIPDLSVVTIGAPIDGATLIEIPPLTRAETRQLLRAHGVDRASHVLDRLHELTGGNVAMLAAVARWWSGDENGPRALQRHLQARSALLNLARIDRFASSDDPTWPASPPRTRRRRSTRGFT